MYNRAYVHDFIGLCGENGILPIKETMEALTDIEQLFFFFFFLEIIFTISLMIFTVEKIKA